MSGAIDIKCDISECLEYFEKIDKPDRVKRITRKALRKGAQVIQAAVIAEAPERLDLPSGTALPVGALKTDIIIKAYTDEYGKEVASIQPGEYTNHVAGFVEFGHKMVTGGRLGSGDGKHTHVKSTGTTFTQPNPFFRRGEEKSETAAVEAIEQSLGEDLIDPEAQGDAVGAA